MNASLAPYAVSESVSRGRRYAEPPPHDRTEFQRDRDRIVHSTAFRRLEYKTQVFVNHEGDLFRTRLTHSLEVAQLTRALARSLCLNEDLAESIALAHDLGHTPFGHAGQDALNACMKAHGGFEHNLQSLRIVDTLEQRYAAFDGLNLTFETREGILKHCSKTHAAELGDVGARFLENRQPSLEAQLANFADGIAYNNHDLDDGLRSGLITLEQLEGVALFECQRKAVLALWPTVKGRRLIHETIRRMVSLMARDLVHTTGQAIARAGPVSLEAVRTAPRLVGHSEALTPELHALKRFLHENLYRHYKVFRMTEKATRIIRDLFEAFMAEPRLLPPQDQAAAQTDTARAVADYIAGMTDRYAIKEHRRLFSVGESDSDY